MKKITRFFCILIFLSVGGTAITSFDRARVGEDLAYRFPYQKAGLSEKEASAHLVSRFSFGVRPGEVEKIAKLGVENWFAEQLDGSSRDNELDTRLAGFQSLKMSNQEIVQTYPKGGQVLKMAIKNGDIDRDSVKKDDKRDYKKDIKQYMQENGLKPQADLLRELVGQKILRAAYSNNQLKEVMTDFWFNHFNVAVSKGGIQQFVTSYERDVIRPNVVGKFEDLLLATAKSPAMLTYLDNNKSSVNEENMIEGQKILGREERRCWISLIQACKKMQTVKLRNLKSRDLMKIMQGKSWSCIRLV